MSERKVLNKYYPPDFDPSKIKRRKGINKDKQMVIRLMAPFSMRCTRCGEYIYKGKKFNARKETVTDEEYYGIHIFRFYIKCTHCSGEITFKTDPKNADYQMELGATRNFENWADADPSGKRVGAMPTAEADDDYDSEGNPLEDKAERDAMADLERTQEQSRREMEMMDELAELRQRNARVETRDVDHDDLLAQLHVERITAAEEEAKRREEEEDDAEVAKYFAKFRAGGVNAAAGGSRAGKANGAGLRVLNGQGEADGSDAEDEDEADAEREAKEKEAAALTIKRRPAPPPNGASNGAAGRAEPSVASILAAKGKTLDPATASGAAHAGAKRKREGMQKLLGIKKKA